MPTVLPRSFYLKSPEVVARRLIGTVLAHRLHGEWLTGRIVEVEAYLGFKDPASHAYGGETKRNAVLFGPPGFAYVYFVYGMHYCMNVSCQPEGVPGGVLLRAIEPLQGVETMARLRGIESPARPTLLASGPGRLCQALGISRLLDNALDVTRSDSPLQIRDDGARKPKVLATARIGLSKAVEEPLRFVAEGSPFVSRA